MSILPILSSSAVIKTFWFSACFCTVFSSVLIVLISFIPAQFALIVFLILVSYQTLIHRSLHSEYIVDYIVSLPSKKPNNYT